MCVGSALRLDPGRYNTRGWFVSGLLPHGLQVGPHSCGPLLIQERLLFSQAHGHPAVQVQEVGIDPTEVRTYSHRKIRTLVFAAALCK